MLIVSAIFLLFFVFIILYNHAFPPYSQPKTFQPARNWPPPLHLNLRQVHLPLGAYRLLVRVQLRKAGRIPLQNLGPQKTVGADLCGGPRSLQKQVHAIYENGGLHWKQSIHGRGVRQRTHFEI